MHRAPPSLPLLVGPSLASGMIQRIPVLFVGETMRLPQSAHGAAASGAPFGLGKSRVVTSGPAGAPSAALLVLLVAQPVAAIAFRQPFVPDPLLGWVTIGGRRDPNWGSSLASLSASGCRSWQLRPCWPHAENSREPTYTRPTPSP